MPSFGGCADAVPPPWPPSSHCDRPTNAAAPPITAATKLATAIATTPRPEPASPGSVRIRPAHTLSRGQHLEDGLGRERGRPAPLLGRFLLRRPPSPPPRPRPPRRGARPHPARSAQGQGDGLVESLPRVSRDRHWSTPRRRSRCPRRAAPGAPRRGPRRAARPARPRASRSPRRGAAPPPAAPRHTHARAPRRAHVSEARGQAAPSPWDPGAPGRRRAVQEGSRGSALAY